MMPIESLRWFHKTPHTTTDQPTLQMRIVETDIAMMGNSGMSYIRRDEWVDVPLVVAPPDSDAEEKGPTVLPGDFVLCPSCKCEPPARAGCGECHSEGVIAAEKGSTEGVEK